MAQSSSCSACPPSACIAVLGLVISADAPPQVLMPPISGRRVVDFGVGLGRRTTYLYNLPEVASAASCMKVRPFHLPPPVALSSQAQTPQRLPGSISRLSVDPHLSCARQHVVLVSVCRNDCHFPALVLKRPGQCSATAPQSNGALCCHAVHSTMLMMNSTMLIMKGKEVGGCKSCACKLVGMLSCGVG